MQRLAAGILTILLTSCSSSAPASRKLIVAAAANLTGALQEAAAAFRKSTAIEVVLSYGSTVQLAQQIENGAPFDVFAAADTEHVDALMEKGRLVAASRAIYARGQLALWVPEGNVHNLADLSAPRIRFIAIAQPALAPYGKAAVEAIKTSGLWEALQPKIVFANNVNMARQYAATGNANAAFTAYSLVLREPGTVIKLDPKLHSPIDQALAIVASSRQLEQARLFTAFLLSAEGRAVLTSHGYLAP